METISQFISESSIKPAILQGKLSTSNLVILEIPLLEFISEFHDVETFLPKGFIVPSPVTTTRLN
tara:strand:- start:1373 stop:1567 length:195 start_codon:yes stop_codon:yes gene_type:complete